MSDSTTPRTDKLYNGINARAAFRGFVMPEDVQDAIELARTLERELAEARRVLQAMVDANNAEAKVRQSLKNAEANFSNPKPELDAMARALVASIKAHKEARAMLAERTK